MPENYSIEKWRSWASERRGMMSQSLPRWNKEGNSKKGKLETTMLGKKHQRTFLSAVDIDHIYMYYFFRK